MLHGSRKGRVDHSVEPLQRCSGSRESSLGEITRFMNRQRSVIFFFILLLCFSFAVDAVTVYSEGPLYYTVENGSVIIAGYFGRESSVTVPSMIAGMPVNTIASGAFADEEHTVVILPDTVTVIQPGAFDDIDELIYSDGNEEPAADPTQDTENERTDSDREISPPSKPEDTGPEKDTVPDPGVSGAGDNNEAPKNNNSGYVCVYSDLPDLATDEIDILSAPEKSLSDSATVSGQSVKNGSTEETEKSNDTVPDEQKNRNEDDIASGPSKPVIKRFPSVAVITGGAIALVTYISVHAFLSRKSRKHE